MKERIFKHYKLKITPLTCVSVTSGEVLTEYDYCLGNNGLDVMDVEAVLQRMSKEDNNIFSKSIKDIAQDVVDNYEANEVLYSISKDMMFSNTLPKGNKNISEIYKIHRGAEFVPVIPGSSVKGAIRTALLNHFYCGLDENKKYDMKEKDGKEIERIISNFLVSKYYSISDNYSSSAQKSVMRGLRITDALPENEKFQIMLIQTFVCPQSAFDSSFSPVMETIPGIFKNFQGDFIAELTLENIAGERFNEIFSVAGLSEVCNNFSESVLSEESKDKRIMSDLIKSQKYEGLDTAFEAIRKQMNEVKKSDNSFLLKIGRHSQAEYVTVSEDLRQIYNRRKKVYTNYGVSRTLGCFKNDYFPIGWCKFTITEE